MGCHKAIAQAIRDKRAGYCLQLKDNHPKVRNEVVSDFASEIGDSLLATDETHLQTVDGSRAPIGNAAENLAVIRQVGIKTKRKMCGWDHDYPLTVMGLRGRHERQRRQQLGGCRSFAGGPPPPGLAEALPVVTPGVAIRQGASALQRAPASDAHGQHRCRLTIGHRTTNVHAFTVPLFRGSRTVDRGSGWRVTFPRGRRAQPHEPQGIGITEGAIALVRGDGEYGDD